MVNVVVNVVNVCAAVIVIVSVSGGRQTVVGLALAHALSYLAGCGLLGGLLSRRALLHPRAFGRQLPRIVIAVVPIAIGLWATSGSLTSLDSRAAAIAGVGFATMIAAAVYVAAARVLGLELTKTP